MNSYRQNETLKLCLIPPYLSHFRVMRSSMRCVVVSTTYSIFLLFMSTDWEEDPDLKCLVHKFHHHARGGNTDGYRGVHYLLGFPYILVWSRYCQLIPWCVMDNIYYRVLQRLERPHQGQDHEGSLHQPILPLSSNKGLALFRHLVWK